MPRPLAATVPPFGHHLATPPLPPPSPPPPPPPTRQLLFDTRAKNGSPILHQLGSVDDSSVLGQRKGAGVAGSAGRKQLVTIGLEDAIAAGGGNAMREGGVRKVLVPAALAYGTAAMSRFDAQQSGECSHPPDAYPER